MDSPTIEAGAFTRLELINIRYALSKRERGMEVYLAKSHDLKKEPLIKRDIGVCKNLVARIDNLIKNGSRTWSTQTT